MTFVKLPQFNEHPTPFHCVTQETELEHFGGKLGW